MGRLALAAGKPLMRRVQVSPLPALGALATLDAASAHHLTRVLRLDEGAVVQAFDGKGYRCEAQLEAHDGCWMLRGLTEPEHHGIHRHASHLVLGLPKGPAAELALRMATELGVSEIHPVIAEHSILRKDKADRWTKILTSAGQQSRRDSLPVLHAASSLPEALARLEGAKLLKAHPYGEEAEIQITGPWAVCVGPEAGWSPRELALLDENRAHNLKVADHVLRTPTAVAAALAVAQRLCVD